MRYSVCEILNVCSRIRPFVNRRRRALFHDDHEVADKAAASVLPRAASRRPYADEAAWAEVWRQPEGHPNSECDTVERSARASPA